MKPANGVPTDTSVNTVPVAVRAKFAPRLVRSRNTAIWPRVIGSAGQKRSGPVAQPPV